MEEDKTNIEGYIKILEQDIPKIRGVEDVKLHLFNIVKLLKTIYVEN